PMRHQKFHLATTAALATVLGTGYFNDWRRTLQVGDVVAVTASLGGTVELADLVVTAVPATGNVTVAFAPTSVIAGQEAPELTAADLTDSSGGTAADTIAAITQASNAGSADVAPVANAIATLAREQARLKADIAAVIALLVAAQIAVEPEET